MAAPVFEYQVVGGFDEVARLAPLGWRVVGFQILPGLAGHTTGSVFVLERPVAEPPTGWAGS